jgi:membrane-associated phospholipid phosphatase
MERPLPAQQFVLNRAIWWLLFALALLTGVWMHKENMTLNLSNVHAFLYIYALFLGVSLFYRTVRPNETIFLFGQLATQWLTAAAVLGVLSYVSARLNYPLNDDWLIDTDRALGFNWQNYIHWVDRSATLAFISSTAYISSGPQMLALVTLLFLYKNIVHIQRFLLAFIFTGVITVILSALFPAVAGYVYYDLDVSQFKYLHPIAARIHEAPLMAMRHHTTNVLSFPMQGLVTFPSFHAALAIVLIYAAWPIRWLRLIAVALNILVLFSTPVDGGHWLTDVLGGVVIALIVIAVIRNKVRPRRLSPRWGKRQRLFLR